MTICSGSSSSSGSGASGASNKELICVFSHLLMLCGFSIIRVGAFGRDINDKKNNFKSTITDSSSKPLPGGLLVTPTAVKTINAASQKHRISRRNPLESSDMAKVSPFSSFGRARQWRLDTSARTDIAAGTNCANYSCHIRQNSEKTISLLDGRN